MPPSPGYESVAWPSASVATTPLSPAFGPELTRKRTSWPATARRHGDALALARGHTRQCFSGRDNARTSRSSYIVQYWE